MAENKFKQKNMSTPIEKQKTAAWANIENLKQKSKVPVPNEAEARNAKRWVDTNQK